MCRIISFISAHPILLDDILINPPHSLTKQVHTRFQGTRPFDRILSFGGGLSLLTDWGKYGANRNLDGFGVGWYTTTRSEFDSSVEGPQPALYRTTIAQPANDTTFLSVCNNTASKAVLAHVRATLSPPVVNTNNHPFVFGRHSLAHNGEIGKFREIRPKILERTNRKYSDMIHGSTDTEHFAALYFTRLDELDNRISIKDIEKPYPARMMWKALKLAIEDILEIQEAQFDEIPRNALNICATDGESMVALRYCSDSKTKTPTLFISFEAADKLDRKSHGKVYEDHRSHEEVDEIVRRMAHHERYASEKGPNAGYRLNPDFEPLVQHPPFYDPSYHLTHHGPHVIIASEPLTYDEEDWRQLREGEAILIDSNKKDLTITFEHISEVDLDILQKLKGRVDIDSDPLNPFA